MELFELFPVPLAIFNLNRDITDEEKNHVLNLPRQGNVFNTGSIDTYVLEAKELQDLKSFFQTCLDNYLSTILDPSTECSLKITQSWCNYSETSEGHHRHHHHNSVVSGVFYINTEEYDKIVFFKPFVESKQLTIIPKQYNKFNCEQVTFAAKQCSLILFPSTIQHEVAPIYRDSLRISLSFNTFYSGMVGKKEQYSELILP